MSTAAAAQPGPVHISTRPANHSSHSAASDGPCAGFVDVQVRSDVSRKPDTIAPPKPNTISCACQNRPLAGAARPAESWPASAPSHASIAIAPKPAPPR
ncbi:hypothetical protein DP42_6051 [Burkholderia pseudomallei]|nr:hypothetical protein DP42_6051 [Burkholderia pseudomallei]KGV98996.1 hypothetical protein X892_1670 [Burkholderia pseudomallei MSHR3960]KGW23190.1 hypothetical protein Y602_1206 [Burkholderia pseudomallei MSHR733]CAJ7974586.1 Uncharacterised protein [Burkholderia pseudomallei]